MIMTQVESFLNGTRIEDVQVVRKIHSITLQVDESVAETFREEKIAKLEPCLNDQIDQDDIETYEVNPIIAESEPDEGIIEEIEDEEFTRCYQCDKCDEVTSTEESLEVHSFMKHSLLGITIETDVENNQELVVGSDGVSTLMRKCPTCCLFFETPTSLTIHLLECHSDEMLMSVVDTTSINFDNITKYIAYIRELMLLNETKFESVFKIEEDFKEYFYQYYSSDMVAGEEQVEDVKPQIKQERIHVIIESKFPKAEKVSVELNDEMRTWLRKEMTLRKKTVKSDCGEKRTIYQCAYCNVYSSNSQPGFRYHLMAKHLKGNNIADLQEVPAEFIPPVTVDKKARNVCRECNIKMKDQKHFESHQNAHELLAVISQHYMLPSCNTCNTVFIDDPALKLHLSKHDTNEDVSEPVIVHPGAMTLQSRKLKTPGETQSDEITDNNFAWNCGHCSMRFNKEVSCRYHLLIHHVSTFACPIDKREFSGFKVISLFCHHLKNKHSEMFPELIFSCTFCKTEFPSVYEKLAHMKNCTLKKFSCDHCGKKFFKKADLEAHLRFISGELFFPCKICDKRCETASDLNIHFRSHTKEVRNRFNEEFRMFLHILFIAETVPMFNLPEEIPNACHKISSSRESQ